MGAHCESNIYIEDDQTLEIFVYSFAFICLIGSPLSSVILLLFGFVKRLRTYGNMLLMTLVVGDWITVSLICPMTIIELKSPKNCDVINFNRKMMSLIMISFISASSIVYYRYLVIVYDMQHRIILTALRKAALLLLPWLIALLLFLCKFMIKQNDPLIITIAISLISLCTYYCVQIHRRLKTSTNFVSIQQKQRQLQNYKAAMLVYCIGMIVVVSMSLSVANRVFRIIHAYVKLEWYYRNRKLLQVAARLLLAVTSVLNPFLYCLKHRQFRSVITRRIRRIQHFSNK